MKEQARNTPAPAWNATYSFVRMTTCRSSIPPLRPSISTPCAARCTRNVHKPLIIFTPKSLLSRPEAVSPHLGIPGLHRFREVLPDPDTPAPGQVTRAVFCTGKIYYDLAAYRRERNISDTVIIRLEQIYPLAQEQLTYLLAPYQKVRDFVWCQEEPSNMGAWGHLRNRLGRLFATSFRYAGRPSMACPAEGAKALHAAAQKRLIAAAFGPRAQS